MVNMARSNGCSGKVGRLVAEDGCYNIGEDQKATFQLGLVDVLKTLDQKSRLGAEMEEGAHNSNRRCDWLELERFNDGGERQKPKSDLSCKQVWSRVA